MTVDPPSKPADDAGAFPVSNQNKSDLEMQNPPLDPIDLAPNMASQAAPAVPGAVVPVPVPSPREGTQADEGEMAPGTHATSAPASHPSAGVETQSFKGVLLMLLAMFTFATQDGITKHLGGQYDPSQIILVRFAAFAAFAAWWAHRRGGFMNALNSRKPVQQIIRCAILVLEIGLFVYIVTHMPLADLHALFAAAPLMVTALSVPLLGEKVGVRRWMAVIVGFCGVIVILRPGAGIMDPLAPLALLGAAMFSLYVIMTRRLSRHDGAATSMLYLGLVGFVGSSFIGPFFWVWPDAWGWFWLISLSITAIFGHTLFIMALETAPAATLQPFQYTILVWAAVMGYAIFGDVPDGFTVLGAAIITASGLYTLYRERVRAQVDG